MTSNHKKIIRDIAGILKIAKSAIAEFLKNPDAIEKRRKTGRSQKVKPKQQRNILGKLKKQGSSIPTSQRESGYTHIIK